MTEEQFQEIGQSKNFLIFRVFFDVGPPQSGAKWGTIMRKLFRQGSFVNQILPQTILPRSRDSKVLACISCPDGSCPMSSDARLSSRQRYRPWSAAFRVGL